MQVHLRSELLARSSEIDGHALVLVTAPGGAGKSTLVKAWRDTRQAARGRMAWLTIGPLHCDPIAFVEDLVEAIREVLSEPLEGAELFGTALLRALPRRGEIEPAQIARLAELELRGLASPLGVCLDAFEHLRSDSPTLEIVDLLLRAGPPWLQLVITTRGLRPDAATRMLADGTAIELGANELDLRHEQMISVLADVGVELERRQAEQLLARTGGWAIAIRFAARALARVERGERSAFIDSLVQERDLFRYIASELVERTPAELAAILEIASLLGPVSRKMLAAAAEDPRALELVEEGIRHGLLQTSGQEISLHELLADWLRLRLEARLDATHWRELHLRLGRLLETHGHDRNALRLYRSIGLVEPVAALLSRAAHGWVNRGYYDFASEALESLPESLRRSDPALIAVAGVIEGSRDPDTAIENLKRAIEMYRQAGQRAAEFEALHELGIIAVNENRMGEVIGMFRYALTLRGVLLEPRLRGMLFVALAGGSFTAGRYAVALRLLDVADRYDHAPRERGGITLVRSIIHFHRGDWDQVVAEVDDRCADEEQREHGSSFFAMQTMRCTVLGLRRIDVAGCQAMLEQASQMFITARQSLNRMDCEVARGKIAMRVGDLQAALEFFSEAAAIARQIHLVEAEAGCSGLLARAYQRLARNREALEASSLALELLEREGSWSSRFSNAPFWSAAVALAGVVQAELGDPARAQRAFEPKRKRLEHRELPISAHALRVCLARVAYLAGNPELARKELREASRIHRNARLEDFAAEVDDALLDWANEMARAVEGGFEGRATGARRPAPRHAVTLRIESLGGLAAYRGDSRVSDREWRGETARRLLMRLLVADGRPVARERIESELWPDLTAKRGSGNLRVALTRLRDALEPRRRKGAGSRYVEVAGERILLTPDALAGWDVLAWREALAALEAASGSQDEARASDALSLARKLRGGTLLPESYDDWTLELRRELDESWLRVGRAAASRWAAVPKTDLAERIARALVEDFRDDERAWEILVEVRIEAGDRSGALRAIAEARAAFEAQLGIELGADFVRLEESIRTASRNPG